jgi:hypothetical protein
MILGMGWSILSNVIIILCAGFMGYAPEIHAIVSDHEIADTDDDQLYYTLIYLDQQKRVCPSAIDNSRRKAQAVT